MVWPKYVWCPKNSFSRCPDGGNHHLVIGMPELGYWYVKYSRWIIWLFRCANDVLKAGKNGRPCEKPLGQMDEKQLEHTQATCGIDTRLEHWLATMKEDDCIIFAHQICLFPFFTFLETSRFNWPLSDGHHRFGVLSSALNLCWQHPPPPA